MRLQPMIQVADVAASSEWYQAVVGLVSAHGGDEFEMLTIDGGVVLQLHRWDAHEHPLLGSSSQNVGNGVSLWFETEEFEAVVERAVANIGVGHVAEGPSYNPLADHLELSLIDPDGYVVIINSPFGLRGDNPAPTWA
jgi:catechol 2,3-dioxygenase-like lactoylglutathione lyase family enzyme